MSDNATGMRAMLAKLDDRPAPSVDPDEWQWRSIARDVVTDYAQMVCDDLANCACSMAQLSRLLTPTEEP